MRNTDNWGARARESYEKVYGTAEFKEMWAKWVDCFITYIGENSSVILIKINKTSVMVTFAVLSSKTLQHVLL